MTKTDEAKAAMVVPVKLEDLEIAIENADDCAIRSMFCQLYYENEGMKKELVDMKRLLLRGSK